MATIVLIVIVVMIVAMVVYIRAVSKVDRAENDFRKESSTIDTFLWDIQHRLKKSGDILEKYEIDASEIRDGDSLGLGMPTSFQVLKFSQYSEKIKKLEEISKRSITDEDDKASIAQYQKELDQLKIDVIAESVAHNKSVSFYNNTISKFPMTIVAHRRHKLPKNLFTYVERQNQE
ncbi:hypothetical protein SAMN05660484_01089 [Eubacterium ruminantium]|jgi:hypothetical protein|uniref:LemA family protein n=1 Tax=Eubacterium ruminantium TaxID=42322 RepID=A0A1T4LB97_9FIRM|nr:hypothetical protein [Eubacterium ruminantium]SCW44698.1 hypothetical protein SAMN05660484_01089 [Eubacterium ruminantium]SDM75881.1 hypothetical protein SAMN04490370_10639 [Eubacterium ruminantium]SJZ51881.1 hypothetical protein SAMN02745110_00769 [Eubacterium ruminantium]